MPTINQLIRKGRVEVKGQSDSPALRLVHRKRGLYSR